MITEDIDLKNTQIQNYLGIRFIATVNMCETLKLKCNKIFHRMSEISWTFRQLMLEVKICMLQIYELIVGSDRIAFKKLFLKRQLKKLGVKFSEVRFFK